MTTSGVMYKGLRLKPPEFCPPKLAQLMTSCFETSPGISLSLPPPLPLTLSLSTQVHTSLLYLSSLIVPPTQTHALVSRALSKCCGRWKWTLRKIPSTRRVAPTQNAKLFVDWNSNCNIRINYYNCDNALTVILLVAINKNKIQMDGLLVLHCWWCWCLHLLLELFQKCRGRDMPLC